MAEDIDKKAKKQPPAAADESPTSHKKKGQFVALGLVVLVVLGLIVQSIANMRARDNRIAKADAADKAPATAANETPANASGRLTEFADKQAAAAAESNEEAKKAGRADRQNTLLERLNGTDGPASPTEDKAKQTVGDIQDAFYISERKRVLDAGRGKLGGTGSSDSGQGRAAPAQSNSKELALVDQKIAELSAAPSQIDQRRQVLLDRAAAAGIVLPADILARAGNRSGAPTAVAMLGAPAGSPTGLAVPAGVTSQGQAIQSSQQNQSFGELASNRVARDPANAGPKPGEMILPTGSIVSLISDMEMISDYAGNWWGLIQRPVYDITQEYVLLPAGTKVTGKSMRATGVNESIQNRMGSIPMWAIRPDGKRLDFRRASAMDSTGVAALKGEVDRHFLAQFLGVGAYAIIGLGPSMNSYGAEPNSSRDEFVKEATGKGRDIGRSFAEKFLNIVPTQKIPPGTPIKLFIEDDIFITPWESAYESHYKRH